MKKIYFTALSVYAASTVFAQVTLTASDINGVIGESFPLIQSSYASPGNAGANQTWDFSGVSTTSTATMSFTAPNGSFPQTNVSLGQPGGELFEDINSNGIYIWGVDAGGTIMTYSNAMTYHEFPLSLGASGSDTHVATFVSGGFNFTRSGGSTWEMDGYGTLTTPTGTYTNVARVHITQTYTDTYPGGTIDYDVDIYIWLKAGIHYPIATMQSVVSLIGSTQYGTYLTGSAGLGESELSEVIIAPNPAQDQIQIFGWDKDLEKVHITDMAGSIVKVANSSSIDISNIKPGIYFVQVQSMNGELSKASKFIKQ